MIHAVFSFVIPPILIISSNADIDSTHFVVLPNIQCFCLRVMIFSQIFTIIPVFEYIDAKLRLPERRTTINELYVWAFPMGRGVCELHNKLFDYLEPFFEYSASLREF